jgi:hypothetical protein
MIKIVLLAVALMASPVYSYAGDTGEDLSKKCAIVKSYIDGNESIINNIDNAISFGGCLGILESIRDMSLFLSMSKDNVSLFCAPENGISNTEAVEIFLTHLKTNPEHAKLAQTGTVLHAYKSAFPCD